MSSNYQFTFDAIDEICETSNYGRDTFEMLYENITSDGNGIYDSDNARTRIDSYVSDNTIEENNKIIKANGSTFNAISLYIEENGEDMLDMQNESRFAAQLAYNLILLAIEEYNEL